MKTLTLPAVEFRDYTPEEKMVNSLEFDMNQSFKKESNNGAA